jgi:hypothetical protein
VSLVNDMLRDLADQQQGARVAAADHQQLLSDSGLGRQQKRVWLPSVLVFILVLVALLVFQYINRTEKISTASAEFFTATPKAVETQPVILSEAHPETVQINQGIAADAQENALVVANALDNTVQQQERVSLSSEPQIEPHPKTVVAETSRQNIQQQAVDAWLRLAAVALAQDKLTSPIEDSALYYFDQVAAIAPGHPQVERGKTAIVERYLQLIREAIAQQQTFRAQTLLERARSINPGHSEIKVLALQIIAMDADNQRLDSNAVVSAEAVIYESDEQQSDGQWKKQKSVAAVSSETAAGATATSYSIPQSLVVAPVVSVKPNLAWQDQQAAEQARALMQQGQLQTAQIKLQNFLQQQSPANLSSQLLCQIFIEQGEFAAAENMLADAELHNWPAIDRARLRAQWLMAQDDNAGALTLLEQHVKDAENDERYRVLLASLYRTMGKYHESVAHYRRLIATFGEKSSYWLGLALSLDALGQKSSALESFRRVRNFQPLQPEVNLYIEQRIAALAR